ncbi:MAG: polyprenyl synthetase family protein [Clostridia bacterium]|nr:polyprenyl synthetase family protein [Clostridia bacterium]
MGISTKEGLQRIKFSSVDFIGIEEIEKELNHSLEDAKDVMKEMCQHILSAGGKRVRPLLVLNSGLVFSGQTSQLLQAATAAELIHMASLVHDDIIDNSDLRRNKPSINKVWGTHFAVLCGDYLFSKAFGILSRNRLIASMDLMVEAIQNMCQGEIIQAGERFNHEISIDRYYEIIGMKTAIFLQCCCKSGAAVSEANSFQLQMIGEYGLNLGYAFQIIDDILDFCGRVETTGKPKCEDVRQGNITLPLILLMKDPAYSAWVTETIHNREFSEETLAEVIFVLNDKGIIKECFHIAAKHILKAKECLTLLPQNAYTQLLDELADMLQARVN